MYLTKESLLKLFNHDLLHSALDDLYKCFGPSVRSEYLLDGLKIIDLDWERFGCVLSFVENSLSQIRLSLLSDEALFNGWIGEGVTSAMVKKDIVDLFGPSKNFSYVKEHYLIVFEFSRLDRIESVILKQKD